MISFSCDKNDTVALNAIASALMIIAQNRPNGETVTVTETSGEENRAKGYHQETGAITTGSGAVETGDPEDVIPDDIDGTPPSHKPTIAEGAAAVDAQCGPNGIRWDARIHSRTKSLDGQMNFKIMRQPKSFDSKADWLTFVSQVETQLKGATMASPTGTTVPKDDGEEIDASNVGFGKDIPGGMFDDSDTGAGDSSPPPPKLEGDTPPPPALEPADDTVITFQDVMKTLTSNKAKIGAKDLLKICNDYGVEKVVNLKEQTPDIVAAIHADMLVIINGS